MPLYIVKEDITKMKVDAIVNTTNRHMIGTKGVDLAVHEGAGPLLDLECLGLVPLGLGTAKITKGYNLSAKYIIHTSGPIWRGGYSGESILLKSCYIESLKLAVQNGCETIAFPLISSGSYGYPKDQVLNYAVEIITEFLNDYEITVYICVFDRESYEFSKKLHDDITRYIDNVEEITYKSTPILPKSSLNKSIEMEETRASTCDFKGMSIHDFVKETDKSFAHKLFDLIDERNMKDPECYTRANVDKKTFSKIRCNPEEYKPTKQTAVAFALALELDMEQTQDLLASAGLTLSTSFIFDKIIMFFIENKKYNVHDVNIALFEFDQKPLGSVKK